MRRLLLALALVAAGCSRRDGEPGAGGAGAAPRNVVLIVIDTLRADHLPFHGYAVETAPFLAGLAAKAAVFERAQAPSSWTVPSVASLFTSAHVIQHGVTLGDRYYRGEKSEPMPALLNRIPGGLETMAEMLRKAGYRTYGVSDNFFVAASGGFDRGFDRFISFNYSAAPSVNRQVERWRKELQKGEGPYFLYLHYVDPHWPYNVRRPWYREKDAATPQNVRAYDSEIGFVDSHIRQLFEAFGWEKNALAIVTSDHGEEFGDHGGEGHRYKLYQELLHVPLLVHEPRSVAAKRIGETVSLVDILPTLRDWLGQPSSHQDAGRSLLPLIRGEPWTARSAYAMRTKEADIVLEEKKALVTAEYKYILNLPSQEEELYDLKADPGERANQALRLSGVLQLMRNELKLLELSARRYPREFVDLGKLDPSLAEQLKSLGYVH
jgi:arylsulfatase A-like enzyme